MGIKVSIYFIPVDGCDNTLCRLRKVCTFSTGEVCHMDVAILNRILQDCYLYMSYIERLYFGVKGNSQDYIHASDIDLGGFSSRCVMSYSYPYPKDNFPTNMCKTYRVDSVSQLKYLIALPDFWGREITKLYSVVSRDNINDVAEMLYMMDELRWKRTFLCTLNSIRDAPDLFVDEKTLLPLLENYQYKKLEDYHITSNRKNGLNITVDHLGRARLCQFEETAFEWTNFLDVNKRIWEVFKASEKCALCLSRGKIEWRYAIS